MAGFGDMVQKAFYLGVGLASYATEKAGTTLADLKVQAQKLADEMVDRGEMTAEEARRMMDEMVQKAQQQVQSSASNEDGTSDHPKEPRRIEIVTDEAEGTESPEQVDALRQQVAALEEQLRKLRET